MKRLTQFITIFLFLITSIPTFAQEKDKCAVLKKILNISDSTNFFFFKQTEFNTLLVLDTSGFFKSCEVQGIFGRNFAVITDTIFLNKKYTDIFEAAVKRKSRKHYVVEILDRCTHGYTRASVYIKRGKYFVSREMESILD